MNIYPSDIDPKSGKITYASLFETNFDGDTYFIDEDLLLIEYENDFAVDVSYHQPFNQLSVSVIYQIDWMEPVFKRVIEVNKEQLLNTLKQAIDIAEKGK